MKLWNFPFHFFGCLAAYELRFEADLGSTCNGLQLTTSLSAAYAASLGSISEPASLPALRYLHATGRSYMYNQQFTWQPPFRLLDWPGLA